MECQKIKHLLDTTSASVPRFITIKWIEIHAQAFNAEDRYEASKQIRFNTSLLQPNYYDYGDAYIVVKGIIIINRRKNRDTKIRSLAVTNNAPFINCISKINNILIDNREDLDVIMQMYNLIVKTVENYRWFMELLQR